LRPIPLQEREESVLSSVIHHYVATAKPVGSQVLAGGLEVSSATVRNVLLDLERKGYLTHPHTSAGRVPRDEGYRVYVDRLMRAYRLNLREKQTIEREYLKAKDEVESLMRHTARILSAMTRLAGVASFHLPSEASLDHFRLVAIDPRKVLVILVLDQGLVREELVRLDEPMDPREVAKVAQVLNSRFAGTSLAQTRSSLLKEAESSRKARLNIVEKAVDLIERALSLTEEAIHLEGTADLAGQPEFREVGEMERMLRLVGAKGPLAKAMERRWSAPGLAIEIGRELPEPQLKGLSFVRVPFRFQGRVAGSLGVLGPTRMAYDRVAGLVRHMAASLEETLERRAT